MYIEQRVVYCCDYACPGNPSHWSRDNQTEAVSYLLITFDCVMARLFNRIWADFTTGKTEVCYVVIFLLRAFPQSWHCSSCAWARTACAARQGWGRWRRTGRWLIGYHWLSRRPQTPQASTCCWHRHPHAPCQLVGEGHYCDTRELR